MRKTIFNEDAEAQLLAIRCTLEGRISENRLRALNGDSPAYGEKEFNILSRDAERIATKLRSEGIENRKIIDSLA